MAVNGGRDFSLIDNRKQAWWHSKHSAMKIRAVILIIFVGVIICQNWQTNAARIDDGMAFHPITQDQYDAILGLTAGEPVISEARLIASGIAALKGIAAGLKLGLSASWLPSLFAGLGGSQRNATRDVLNLQDGYPLCVVKQQGEDDDEDEDEEDPQDKRDIERTYERPNRVSVVRCVVVVKRDADEDTTTTTTTPAPQTVPNAAYAAYNHYPHYGYPYPYPWYNGYYPAYHQQYEHPYDYAHDQYDFVPNFRHYTHSYEKSHSSQTPHKSYTHSSSTRYKPKYATKSYKSSAKNRKPNPAPTNYYDYTAPPRTKRTKTKRDQHSTLGNPQSYTETPNYSELGYQPASYPQVTYHTQYPKISYSPSYNYPSPVYVGTTPRPTYTA